MTDAQPLTAAEHRALALTGQLAMELNLIVGNGPSRGADLQELVHHLHAIQHTIMAQAAARTYPETLRLLGEDTPDLGIPSWVGTP